MMTQRPVMGSLRNSGKASLLERVNLIRWERFERRLDRALYRVFAAWRTPARLMRKPMAAKAAGARPSRLWIN
jgi:hypothetical protein